MRDLEGLNHLPVEIKVMIVNGQTLVDETRKNVKGSGADLTCRLQLRDDCAAVEKAIAKLQKKKWKQKDVESLRLAIIRLRTTSEGILKKSEGSRAAD